MNFERIRHSIDVERMNAAHVTAVGGAYGLIADLTRCGLGAATLVDFDHWGEENIQRQDVTAEDAARRVYKTHACARHLRGINPQIRVETLERDFCSLTESDIDAHFGHTDLFIFATDSFAAQARGNLVALRLGVAAIWIGLYAGGRAGEVIYYSPGVTAACYRCICSGRYAAHTSGSRARAPSDGGTILDLRLVDAIAGQPAVGLLTRGADNRFGKLIDQLGNRNLFQIKIDPGYTLNGKDIFARHLGDGPANFSFTTIALPMEREPNCPDCGGKE